MKFSAAIFLLLSITAKAADANTLPTLAPADGKMPPTFFEQYGTLIIIGVFAFFILAIFVLWKISRPKPAIILPPEIIAREALGKLQRQTEDGKLLSDVSQILRRYICAVLEFPKTEMTTAEFCAALADNKKISDALAQTISNFLRECDERKFSAAHSLSALNAVQCASELIDQLEKSRAESRAHISAAK